MSRVDQENVTVHIDWPNLGDLKTFQTFSGGALKSDDTKNRPGNMQGEESLGGVPSRDPITVTRNYKIERDHHLIKALDRAVGKAKVSITRTVLNRDGTAQNDPITYTGILMNVTPGDHDSASADAKMLSLEISADEPIS